MKSRPLIVIILAGLAALAINMAIDPGQDMLNYESLIQCFSSQVWHGHFYPRWCGNANGGLGSPVFIFYFPFSFWLATLFYPLLMLGLHPDIFFFGLLTAIVCAGGSLCYLWLKSYFSRTAALAASVFYMFTPYWNDRHYNGTDYPELCFMALLPLLFICARRVIARAPAASPAMALCYAACLLTHIPGAIAAGAGIALYTLCSGKAGLRAIMPMAASALLAMAIAAIHWAPAIYYHAFIHPMDFSDKFLPIVNRYPNLQLFSTEQLQLLLSPVFTLLPTALLGLFYCLSRTARASLPSPVKQELNALLGMFVLSLLLFFPVLKPIWLHVTLLHTAFFPWRTQMLWTLPLAFLIACTMQRRIERHKPWKIDAAVILAMLMLEAIFAAIPAQYKSAEDIAARRPLQWFKGYEYHTQWMDYEANNEHVVTDQYHSQRRWDATDAQVEALWWDDAALQLHIRTPHKTRLVLHKFYFPSWLAEGAILSPQPISGRMALDVPQGEHIITLRNAPYAAGPWWVRLSPWLSAAAFACCILWRIRRKEHETQR